MKKDIKVFRWSFSFNFIVMINRSRGGERYFWVRGEILRSQNDQHKRRHFSTMFSLVKSESGGIEDD